MGRRKKGHDGQKKTEKKIKLHALTLENDIKYRGPLSYREFKILGWFCIILTQVIVMMNLGGKVNAAVGERLSGVIPVFQNISEMALPLLLISNFAIILDNRENYKRQLITNGLLMLSLIVLFHLLVYHFIIGSLEALSDGSVSFLYLAEKYFRAYSANGFFCFNIYVDLFLCTLFMFFLNYRPARFFQGKKIIIFRLFAVLPVLYEIASIALKWYATGGLITLPFVVFPLLTVKPPMTFIVFMVLAAFVKKRESRFISQGGTHEQYQVFLQTNRNSLSFGVFAAVVLLVAGLLDLALTIAIPISQSIAQAEMDAALIATLARVLAVGVGGSVELVILAPFMLLFSYTRKRAIPIIDTLVPVLAIVMVLLVYLQSFNQIMHVLPISGKLNLSEVLYMIENPQEVLPLLLMM